MNTLCFLDKCLAKFEIAAVVILLATAAVLNFIQVVARYFLNLSFNALEEISVYFIIALVFVGLMRADRNRQNISIDIIHNYLSPSAANILWTIADGFLCITALSLAYFTSQSVIFSHMIGETSVSSLGFPIWLVMVVMPPCFLIIGIRAALRVCGVAQLDNLGNEKDLIH